jgi:hypothetical protein
LLRWLHQNAKRSNAMSDEPRALEEMTCDELLKELARLTSERDHTQSQIGTPGTATPEQLPQVNSVAQQGERMDRIAELIKSKGCQ